MNSQDLLSTADVAGILNVSRAYVTQLADAGQLGDVHKTADGRRQIPAAAVEVYREEQLARSRKALEDSPLSRNAGLQCKPMILKKH